MASIAITAATPKMIPNAVRSDRILLDNTASTAIYRFASNRSFMAASRSLSNPFWLHRCAPHPGGGIFHVVHPEEAFLPHRGVEGPGFQEFLLQAFVSFHSSPEGDQ